VHSFCDSRYEPGNSQTDESEMLPTRPRYPVTECRQRVEFTPVVVSVLFSSLKLGKTETSRWLSRVPAAVTVSHKVSTLETATELLHLSSPIAKVIQENLSAVLCSVT